MRFVTFQIQNDSGQRPGLLAGNGSVLDLPRALALAQTRGLTPNGLGATERLIDIIAGGEPMLAACRAVLGHADDADFSEARHAAGSFTLLAPIPRPAKNVFCVGKNYRAHISEGARAQKIADEVPKYPVFFSKPPTAVIGPGASIEIDANVSEKMDYEVELGVVIGKPGRNIAKADAAQHIFGFTIINDISARDIQRRHGGQYLKGKGLDTSCPMGPVIVTIDELPNYQNLGIKCFVNGEGRQDGNTGDMIYAIDVLVESLSEGLTLESGDLLATGTPSGVGYAMEPPHYLKDGDTVTCEVEGIGELTNSIRDIALTESAA
jgi:2-keto-4-pentenoate hydratase/2-oxohepta-3-ene-1,7-dioic acid hydratase in catechol pathway